MPIYEYICSDCRQKFELLKPMSQAGRGVSCPKCGGKAGRVLSICSHADESLDFMDSGGGSSCSSCSSDSCDTCSL